MSKRLLLFVLVSLLAVVLGFITFTPSQAVAVVRKVGYWIILAEFLLFVWYLYRTLRTEWRQASWVQDAKWIGVILAGTVFLHVQEPHAIKIMADDAVMNSTAFNMHFERDPTMLLRAYDMGGNFIPTVVFLDKRPLFFPLLVSLVHDLTGYRFENVFWLNGLLTFFFLSVLFLIGRRLAGFGGGLLAVLLLMSLPLFAQNVAGAGFELTNMLMIVVTLWLGMRLLEAPSDERLSAFLLCGVLLAQTRYESALFLAPVAATVGYLFWRERALRLTPLVTGFPLLLILIPLQHNVFKISEGSWQLNDVKGATTVFGLQYFYENVGHALVFFFNFNGLQPSSWWLAALGIAGVALSVLVLYKQHRDIFKTQPAQAVWLIFFIGLLLHTALMLCYFWGKWDDPIIRRLSLPCHILLALAFVAVVPQLISWSRRWVVLCGLTGLFIFAVTIPVLARGRFTAENVAARVANWTFDFAKTQRGRIVLALDSNGGALWLVNRQAAGTVASLVDRADQFLYHYKVRTFDDIFVVQRLTIDLKTGGMGIVAEDDLGSACKLETVKEKRFGLGYFVRIARMTSVDPEEFRAWTVTRQKERKMPVTELPQIKIDRISDQEWFNSLP